MGGLSSWEDKEVLASELTDLSFFTLSDEEDEEEEVVGLASDSLRVLRELRLEEAVGGGRERV